MAICRGDFVKIQAGGERIWTIVTDIDEQNWVIYAVVDSDMIDADGFSYGDEVMYGLDDVLEHRDANYNWTLQNQNI